MFFDNLLNKIIQAPRNTCIICLIIFSFLFGFSYSGAINIWLSIFIQTLILTIYLVGLYYSVNNSLRSNPEIDILFKTGIIFINIFLILVELLILWIYISICKSVYYMNFIK